MNYYNRHIGDYHKKAGRLSMLQHGAYTLLMDAIYDREKFPTLEQAIDWVWASNNDEIEAVTFVINKFFTDSNGVYSQARIQEEIQHYQAVCASNAINGKKGGRPKGKTQTKANKTQSVNLKTQSVNLKSENKANESDLKPNQEPITNNQEPITNNNKTEYVSFDAFWNIYPKKSDKKKAAEKWKRLKVTKNIFTGIEQHLINKQAYSNTETQFIPNPLTYLNGEKWNDEVTQPKFSISSKLPESYHQTKNGEF